MANCASSWGGQLQEAEVGFDSGRGCRLWVGSKGFSQKMLSNCFRNVADSQFQVPQTILSYLTEPSIPPTLSNPYHPQLLRLNS